MRNADPRRSASLDAARGAKMSGAYANRTRGNAQRKSLRYGRRAIRKLLSRRLTSGSGDGGCPAHRSPRLKSHTPRYSRAIPSYSPAPYKITTIWAKSMRVSTTSTVGKCGHRTRSKCMAGTAQSCEEYGSFQARPKRERVGVALHLNAVSESAFRGPVNSHEMRSET